MPANRDKNTPGTILLVTIHAKTIPITPDKTCRTFQTKLFTNNYAFLKQKELHR